MLTLRDLFQTVFEMKKKETEEKKKSQTLDLKKVMTSCASCTYM